MRFWKKVVICLLTVSLLLGPALPVFAADRVRLSETQEQAFNHELWAYLAEEYGEDQAPLLFDALQKLRLVDEQGNFIRHDIEWRGRAYTLDGIREVLADETVDLTEHAVVDGQPVPLAALKQMIELEERIASEDFLKERITAEHLDSLQSLLLQASQEGINPGQPAAGSALGSAPVLLQSILTGSGDYGDETIVYVTQYKVDSANRKFSLTFQLSKAQPKEVSFAWELMEGSLGSVDPSKPTSGRVVFPAGQTVATLEITGKNVNPAMPSPGMSATDFAQRVWGHFARADYIHFHDFVNFDKISFEWMQQNWGSSYHNYYYVFQHTYQGGAYLAYATQQGGINDYGDARLPHPAYFYYMPDFQVFNDPKHENSILEVKARPGHYTTGQIVIYTVRYRFPVIHLIPVTYDNRARLELNNGQTATPAIYTKSYLGWPLDFGSLSMIRSYQTVVQKGNYAPKGYVVSRALEEGKANAYNIDGYTGRPNEKLAQLVYSPMKWAQENNQTLTFGPARTDAFVSIETDRKEYILGETATITVKLDTGGDIADWIIDGSTTPELLAKKVKVSIGDLEHGLVEMDWKRVQNGLIDSPLTLTGTIKLTEDVFDLMTDANRPEGKLRAKIYYNRSLSDNVENFGMLDGYYAYFTVKRPTYILPGDLEIVYPDEWPSGTPYVVSLIDPVPTALGYRYPDNATFVTPDQFVWESSNPEIADITSSGTIVPKKAGKVQFILTARNNDELPAPTRVTSVELEISADGDAAIVIPSFANKVHVYKNHPATIVWSTNIMDLYREKAMDPADHAVFDITLYDGFLSEDGLDQATILGSWQTKNTSQFMIDPALMNAVSVGHTPRYTVKVEADHPNVLNRRVSAVAYLVVKPEPALVSLDKSHGNFFTDDIGELSISWTLENFDPQLDGDFEFQVTRNGQPVPGARITFDPATDSFSDPSAAWQTGGEFHLPIAPVEGGKGRIRDSYAVTIAARSGPDSTWSYDSMYLHVYDADALKILVDGQAKSEHVMSNVDWIRTLSPEQILDLDRNISLSNTIGINAGDFSDLSAVTDQIAWQSSNKDAATLYFKSYGTVAELDDYGYASYQPKHTFMLAGLHDGRTQITATHVTTGMTAALDLSVETLKDKLYLFQFYPKAPTTITYTDGLGQQRQVTSNGDGELALFDENGIHSQVYVTSKFNGTTYTGVIPQERLLSGEGNPGKQELYPVNILQLRQLSKVEIEFKRPDGKPYTGQFTYRGGVFKNGHFAERTLVTGSGSGSSLKLEFDTTNFYSEAAGETNAADLSAKDKIDFILEVMFQDDQYYPMLLTLDGNTNAVDMIAFGEKIAQLRVNEDGDRQPFMVNQYITANGEKADILGYKGKFGPSNHYPEIRLITEFMWWGEKVDPTQAAAEFVSNSLIIPSGQSYETYQLPFSEWQVTRHVQVLNEYTLVMWLEQAESVSFHYRLYKGPGELRKTIASAASLINMIGVEEMNLEDAFAEIDRLKQDMLKVTGGTASPNGDDETLQKALVLLSKLRLNVGPLTLGIFPTEDPLVFQTIFSLDNIGDVPNPGPSGVQVSTFSKLGLIPSPSDAKQIKQGTYFKNKAKEFAKYGTPVNEKGDKLYSAAGYYLGEIYYNTLERKWEYRVLGGGFTAGGGYQYSTSWNGMAGPIPVTMTFTIGAAVDIDFRASVLYYPLDGYKWANPRRSSVNDYLTTLRLVGYMEVFGGVGFDYSVVAAKVGSVGRLLLENRSSWLNRNYLANAGDRVKFGNKLTLEGMIGIEVVAKFLFFDITYDIVSYRYNNSFTFNNWDYIQQYWQENNAAPLTASSVDQAVNGHLQSFGPGSFRATGTMTVEERNPAGGNPPALFGSSFLLGTGGPLQTWKPNAYAYAHPRAARDGSLFVYLSDGGSTAIEDTAASWALKVGNAYVDQGPIITDPAYKGYGDANLQVAGEGNLVAAAWVHLSEPLTKNPGDPVTNADILLMNNSTEIVVAIYDGATWTPHRITSNVGPDLAPVVAVGNDKVFVAYRNVYTSNVNNPLDFSEHDNILYTVYDKKTGLWSEPETLYNGSNGTVMGLSAETLANGRTAVVFALKPDNGGLSGRRNAIPGYDHEIVYAVIDTDAAETGPSSWKTKGVVKMLQLTTDDDADENPQLTSATFPDGEERFIIGWYGTKQTDGGVTQDIKLIAVNSNGEVYPEFIDSLQELNSFNDMRIDPRFTFVKMPKDNNGIGNLSILWKVADTEIGDEEIVMRDILKAVKFGVADDDVLYLSGLLDVAVMPDYTEIDSIDALISEADGTGVEALIVGTTTLSDATQRLPVVPGNGNPNPVTTYKTVNLYVASGTLENRFSNDDITLNPQEIVPGYDLPIRFNVVNQGLNAIESVTVTVDGQSVTFGGMNLMPNRTALLTVPYTVPAAIKDIAYRVEATFEDGSVIAETGDLVLDIPDLGIGQIRIREEDGKRHLSIPIYGKNDATLAGKGKTVKLGLYGSNKYDDDSLVMAPAAITDDAELAMIDNGTYLLNLEFDLKAYLATRGLSEVPENGLTLFARVWMEDQQGEEIREFDDSNNSQDVLFENLSVKYNQPDVLLTVEQTNENSATSVRLTMQNLNMAPITSGNVLINLLDRDGQIIESRYLVTDGSALLDFGPEEKKKAAVTFSTEGHDVQALFFRESADDYDATLSAVSLSGIALQFDPNAQSYQLQANDLKTTRIVAAATNSRATVILQDGGGNAIATGVGHVAADLPLLASQTGESNFFSIRVVPASAGGTPQVYDFLVVNTKTDSKILEVVVKGTKLPNGTYAGAVEVALSRYDVSSYPIEKARYQINGGAWIDVNYDGREERTLAALKAGRYRILAQVVLTSGQVYTLDPVTIEVVPGSVDPATSEVKASRTVVTADGIDESVIAVTLRDSAGNALTGRTVSITPSGGSSVISAVYGTTDSEGQTSFTVKNSQAESVTYIVEDVASATKLNPVTIVFVASPVNGTNSTVTASPQAVTANGRDASLITVTLRDAVGRELAGRAVALEPDGGYSVITVVYGTTNLNGQALFSVTNTKAETVRYTARDVASGVTLAPIVVQFVAGEVDAAASSITASRTRVKADGRDQAAITVTFRDAFGNPVGGRNVLLEPGGGHSVITAVYGTTNENGEAYFTVTNTRAETVSYTARDAASGTALPPLSIQFYQDDPSSSPDVQPIPATETEPAKELPDESVVTGENNVFREDLIRKEALAASIADRLAATPAERVLAQLGDIRNHWARDAIVLLARLDAIRGYGDGSFRPNQPVTRAEFASMLVRLLQLDGTGKPKASFRDVQAHWGREAIETLAALGIASGYPDGTFRPDEPITREEIAVLLMRVLAETAAAQTGGLELRDLSEAGAFAREAIAAAIRAGIISGYTDQTFRPKNLATRAETAVLLAQLLKLDPDIRTLLGE